LHASFHPKTYLKQHGSKDHHNTTYIVKLDQLIYPSESKIIELIPSSNPGAGTSNLGRLSASPGFGVGVPLRNHGFSINRGLKGNDSAPLKYQIEDEEDDFEEIKEVVFSRPPFLNAQQVQ
jgi:hypothetical protein